MEVKKEELLKRYSELSDDELLDLYNQGTLTSLALTVISEELQRRGKKVPEYEEKIPTSKDHGNNFLNYFWLLFFASLGGAIANYYFEDNPNELNSVSTSWQIFSLDDRFEVEVPSKPKMKNVTLPDIVKERIKTYGIYNVPIENGEISISYSELQDTYTPSLDGAITGSAEELKKLNGIKSLRHNIIERGGDNANWSVVMGSFDRFNQKTGYLSKYYVSGQELWSVICFYKGPSPTNLCHRVINSARLIQ